MINLPFLERYFLSLYSEPYKLQKTYITLVAPIMKFPTQVYPIALFYLAFVCFQVSVNSGIGSWVSLGTACLIKQLSNALISNETPELAVSRTN